jgi:hypothetical protein
MSGEAPGLSWRATEAADEERFEPRAAAGVEAHPIRVMDVALRCP